ncbi:MAG: bifunctional folylpolyglutamate synthase/dihydrofolate synthase [Acidobacteriaceae bacterium]|nr:bifunctional folylpolyglutamate synthase/dihydrofolate synthase [Acidobacteriaceae bacterium]
MSYVSAVDHLHGLGLELASSAPKRKFDLAHMRVLAAALGDPQQRFPSVLIAGTNGKGSTAATLASICAAAGLRTALYTSPHLVRVTERIRTTGPVQSGALIEIGEEDFARLYFHVDETARRLVATGDLPHTPSFFESLTALAFLYFAERKVEIAIVEVGLGGRLDATNIVDPLLSIITDIALDHQEYLGDTIAQIAREKAGILRCNGTLVTLPQLAEANQSIGEIAVALDVHGINAAEFLPDRSRSPQPSENTATPLRANHYTITCEGKPLNVQSPLAGEHQRRNLALAIAAATTLRNKNSYNIANSAIEAGIRNTTWPARLEFLPPDLLLDVAHNPAGAWTLRAAIAALPEEQPRTLIFSCLRDKDLTEMARILFPLFDSAGERPLDHIVFAPIHSERAASLDALRQAAAALEIPAHTANSPAEALKLARTLTPAGGLIVATGSIYLVGELREAVLER